MDSRERSDEERFFISTFARDECQWKILFPSDRWVTAFSFSQYRDVTPFVVIGARLYVALELDFSGGYGAGICSGIVFYFRGIFIRLQI